MNPHFRLPILFTAILLFGGSALSQPTWEMHPTEVLLGQFSAVDATDNIWGDGTTEITLRTDIPWRLTAQLTAPVRRVSDGLELPAERARDLFPDIGEEFANYLPFELDYGPASDEDQVFDHSWEVIQLRLEQYLDPGDPPGIYQAEVVVNLEDRNNTQIAESIPVIFEFEVVPWIELELGGPFIVMMVTSQEEYGYSEPFPIRVRSNTSWELSLACLGDFLEVDGDGIIGQELAGWMVPPGEGWSSLVPDFVQASHEETVVARSEAPEPFTVTDVEIPVQLRCGPLGIVDAAEYAADLDITARVEIEVQ